MRLVGEAPELSAGLHNQLSLPVAIVGDVVRRRDAGCLDEGRGVLPVPRVDRRAVVEDEAVPVVHGLRRQGHLGGRALPAFARAEWSWSCCRLSVSSLACCLWFLLTLEDACSGVV